MKLGHRWLFLNGIALCLHSAAVRLNVFFYSSDRFFVCLLFFSHGSLPRRSWITYSFRSPKLIEFLSKFHFRKGARESENGASPEHSTTVFCLSFHFLPV